MAYTVDTSGKKIPLPQPKAQMQMKPQSGHPLVPVRENYESGKTNWLLWIGIILFILLLGAFIMSVLI